jgi:hypothetical protein
MRLMQCEVKRISHLVHQILMRSPVWGFGIVTELHGIRLMNTGWSELISHRINEYERLIFECGAKVTHL